MWLLLSYTMVCCCRFLVTSDHGNADDMVQREKKTNKPLLDADSGVDVAALLALPCWEVLQGCQFILLPTCVSTFAGK